MRPRRSPPLTLALSGLASAAASAVLGPVGAALGVAAAIALRDDPTLAASIAAGAAAGLLVPRTSGTSLHPAPGLALTVWTGSDLESAWRRQRDVFVTVQPQIALLHANFSTQTDQAISVAAGLREAVPGIRIWTQLSTNAAMTEGAQAALDAGHRLVSASGSEAVCWNAERAFKVAGGADVARAIVEGWKPTGVPQLQSAYSSPTGHHDYPWAAWLVDGCMGSLAQDYPFGDDFSGTAPYGTLVRRVELGREGWARAVREGLIGAEVARGTYIPGDHLEARDVESATAGSPYVAVWPWHGRYSAEVIAGLRAVRARF